MKFNRYSKLLAPFIGFLFLIVHCNTAMAQYKDGKTGNGIMPNITPVSPEASSLGKYGDWPVSYYTGTVGISIPIYQIKTNGFELPIQLSYHTGGIKIDEVPALCGTGWTLNAGGAITRTIIGLPDEEFQGFYSRNKRNEFIKTAYNLNTPQGYAELRKIADRQIDTEPDMFFFNFAGNSGKFYFDSEGNFQCIPVNCLKLISSPITDNLNSHWEIVDEQGNHFFFGTAGQGIENTTIKNTYPSPIEVQEPNAWYLTKIILNNNADTIFFDYVDKAERYVQSPVFSYKIAQEGLGSASGLLGSGVNKLTINQVLRNGSYDVSNDPTAIIIGGKTSLNKIRWSLGEINFDANMSRQDIAFGKNLTKITVLNKQFEKLKETLFSYTYAGGRYYLDNLTEFGANGVKNYAHNFEYYDRDQLPLRNSNAQDHWGYYNGANGNTHLLPPNPAFNNTALNANREPNENFMVAGSLKKIIYPTGGITEYEYEANRYVARDIPGGGNPSGQIISGGKTVSATDPQTTTFQRIETFNIPFDQNLITVKLKFGNYGKPPRKTAGLLPLVKLQKLVNQSYQDVYSWDAFDNFPSSNPVHNQNNLYDYDVDKSISLTTGDYRIVANILPISFGEEEPPLITPSVMAIINYQKYSEGGGISNPTEPIAGGLRIKQINNYTNGIIVSKKQYTYAGGNLLLYPKYVHEYGENVWPLSDCYNNIEVNCNIMCFELFLKYKESISSGQTVLGFTQGSPVGYTSIVEKEINSANETNGYTQYSYSYEADNLNELQFDFSYWRDTEILNSSVPLNNNELKRGLLLEKKTFKRNSDGTFVEVSSTENIYDFNIGNITNRYNSTKGMRVKKMRFVDYSCGTSETGYILPSTGYAPDFAYAYYDIYTSWIQSKSTIEKNYDTNGLNPIITRTNFNYNNPYHLQPTTISKANSDELINEKQLVYPHEMVTGGRDPNGIYQKMIAKNMITKVIEQREIVKGKFSQLRTNYKEPILGLYVPGTVEYRNTETGNDEVRLRYLNYSNNGNIQSLSLDFGAKISYLYSYNSQYPIAEIKNADYATIESLLGGALAVSNFAASNPTNVEVNTFINLLRNSPLMKDSQITTYTYKPLVGMTSSTDAKGMTTYYEYDAFQHLKTIKDQNGNILKTYDYHYKN